MCGLSLWLVWYAPIYRMASAYQALHWAGLPLLPSPSSTSTGPISPLFGGPLLPPHFLFSSDGILQFMQCTGIASRRGAHRSLLRHPPLHGPTVTLPLYRLWPQQGLVPSFFLPPLILMACRHPRHIGFMPLPGPRPTLGPSRPPSFRTTPLPCVTNPLISPSHGRAYMAEGCLVSLGLDWLAVDQSLAPSYVAAHCTSTSYRLCVSLPGLWRVVLSLLSCYRDVVCVS